MDDVIRHLEQWVEREPEHPVYSFLDSTGRIDQSYSYRRLHLRSNYLAAHLADSGAAVHGRPVLLVYPPGLEVMVAFLACVKLGALPVPVPHLGSAALLASVERLAHIQEDARATAALTDQRHLERVRTLAGSSNEAARWLNSEPLVSLRWLPTDPIQGEAVASVNRVHPLLFLQYSSGSTQKPRGVIVSHRNVVCNCRGTVDHRAISVTWLPHFHDMGLIGSYLFALLTGASLYGFSPLDFLQRPLLWLETMSRVGATIASAPNFAYEYCLREEEVPDVALETLDLRSMRRLINGSEPARSDTMQRFRDRFSRCGLKPDALVVGYGLAENTLTVSLGGRRQLALDRRGLLRRRVRTDSEVAGPYRLVSCGTPVVGTEVRIVDPECCAPLPDRTIGEIWVRGDSKAQGYWNQPELSREVFDAGLADGESGYLKTGDLGFMQDGELFVCGRNKDVIIVRGCNYYPQDIEAAVEQASPAIRRGGVAAFAVEADTGENTVVVLAELDQASPLPDLPRIYLEVRRRCYVHIHVLALVPSGTIARTSSGKIARHECKRRFQAGELKPQTVLRMPAQRRPELPIMGLDFDGADELTLAELGVDSLDLVNISLQLRKRFGAETVPASSELWDLKTLQAFRLGEIRQLLASALRGSRPSEQLGAAFTQKLRQIEQAERAQMRQDAVLPGDVVPHGPAAASRAGSVLLTGATGFLGAFLLEALLCQSDSQVTALVRSQDADQARSRLQTALQHTGLWDDALADAFQARVTALSGDLAAPALGLPAATWDRLATELTAVYHCGAMVDYVKPYNALRAANVAGTIELLRLASQRVVKPFHLVSTTFIFGWTLSPRLWETDCNADMAELDFGYAQTKWVAEQLAYAASKRGLPVVVYRPSLITASRQARYARTDVSTRVLTYLIRHGIGIDCANQISFLPVDVAARNLIALSLMDLPTPVTFHLTADNYYALPAVLDVISQEFGYSFRYLDLADFVRSINTGCRENELLFPLVPFFTRNYRKMERMRDKRYDNTTYRQTRACSPWTVPEPSLTETVSSIVRFLQLDGLVEVGASASRHK
jgi:thioester reductase-like protein